MDTIVLLINEETVRTLAGINENVSSKQLNAAIYEAQSTHFQRLIGTKCYDKLVNLVSTKAILRPKYAAYKELLDKSATYLAYMAAYRLIMRLSTKIGNLGINKAVDENLNTTDEAKAAQHFLNMGDYEAILLRDYIKHTDLVQQCNVIGAEHTIASTGIFLGGMRGKRIVKI